MTNRVYLDNAATTVLDSAVLSAMMPYLTEKFGNPSSVYSYGRESKMAIENARKTVSKLLNCKPSEVFFTSGGTESSNTAIHAAVKDLGCSQIISSPIEHHATTHTIEAIAQEKNIKINWLEIDSQGNVCLDSLETHLANHQGQSLITLMHANNEIGNLLDLKKVSILCEKYNAILHSDMVQTIGHYPIDISDLKVHFASAAGHKFHGPKGVGLLYVNDSIAIKPFINGGSQERNIRAGTENLYGIVGFAKALEMAYDNFEVDMEYITSLKKYMTQLLKDNFKQIIINSGENSLYSVLNVSFPRTEKSEVLMMNLDIAGICVSGGSACTSGVENVSHVIQALHPEKVNEMTPIRFSFSKNNTIAELDYTISKIKEFL